MPQFEKRQARITRYWWTCGDWLNITGCRRWLGAKTTAEGYRLLGESVAKVIRPELKIGDVVVCFGDSITFGAHMKGAGTAKGDTYPSFLKRALEKSGGQ